MLSGPLGGATNYTYDDMGRLIAETTSSGGTVSYGYNELNIKEQLTNARGQVRKYFYDACGRVSGFVGAEDSVSYTYDANGNVLTVTDSNGTLTFRANGDFSKFTCVKVDDTLIDAKNYTAVSGSTVITLKTDYLETLSVGTHKLTVVYNDGECSTNFEVKAASEQTKPTDTSKPADSQSPQTGDNSNLTLWFAILFISGVGMLGTTVYKKRKNSIID